MKIIILVGNCGSGKTSYIFNSGLLNTLSDPVIVDDLVCQEDMQQFMTALEDHRDIVLADPFLCIPKDFTNMMSRIPEKYEKIILYFENDLSACLDNCEKRRRETGKIVSPEFVRRLWTEYNPPESEPLIPVWKNVNTLDNEWCV